MIAPKLPNLPVCFQIIAVKKATFMAKLSLTIVPGKTLNDGKHKVRFAVVHNSQTRRIITD